MERWRQPVVPLAIETDADEFYWDGIGWRKHVDVTLKREDLFRIEHGYVCVNCYEPQETPFPENCSLCNFPMAQKQRQMVEFEYRGAKKIGPSTTLADELGRLEDWDDRRVWTPGGSISVPRGPSAS